MCEAMRFLVFSDTHGATSLMSDALSRNIGHADGVFFLGDGQRDIARAALDFPQFSYFSVSGNCDFSMFLAEGRTPELQLLSFCGQRILLVHGHLQNAKYGDSGLFKAAREQNADILLYGHTHTARFTRLTDAESPTGRPLYLCNPGSAGGHSACGNQYGVLELCGDGVLFSVFPQGL